MKYDVGYEFHGCKIIENNGKSQNKIYVCLCHCGQKFECKSVVNRKSCGCNYYTKYYGDMPGSYWTQVKIGATKKRTLEFKIMPEYAWSLFLKQNGKCAYTGQDLKWGTKGNHLKGITASIDRIDNNKGYIEGNIQWVHKDVNLMKRALSNEEFIKICNLIAKNHPR